MHSLSKRSNLAGYRCAFVAGDPAVVGELLAVRKNLGLQMPMPQQRAMVAALDDDAHVVEQHARYAARRAKLKEALAGAGFRGEDYWDTIHWLQSGADKAARVIFESLTSNASIVNAR